MKSPLNDWHLSASAKMADFGGWDMPIEYSGGALAGLSGGVLAEHQAVRERVGLFDVSHLGKIHVQGAGARDFVNRLVTNDLMRISDGSAQYNLLCDESGGVIDDLIVYQRNDSDLFLVPNAANCRAVADVLSALADGNISVVNVHEEYGVLALQGPLANEVLGSLGLSLTLDYMQFTEVFIPGHEEIGQVIICRTGYTGEFGFELIPSWSQTQALWELLVAEVSVRDGRVCGLGARDTLRTEMGYPLHGHELSLQISPLQANAGWAVSLSKPEFLGREALMLEKSQGVKQILRGIKSLDRGIPRPEMSVLNSKEEIVGTVTSGTFSPTLKIGIGLALLSPDIALGDRLTVDVRGRQSQVEVVKPPFVPSHVR